MRHRVLWRRYLAVGVAVVAATSVAPVAGAAVQTSTDTSSVVAEAPGQPGIVLPTLFPTSSPQPTTPPSTATPSPTLPTGGTATPSPTATPTPTPTPTPKPTTAPMYKGPDGTLHPAAPLVVRGRNKDNLFFGEEFDSNCYDGKDFLEGMRTMNRLTKILEKSGRRAYFTAGPNKGAVETSALKGVRLPHGACTRRGLYAQNKIIDTFPSDHFIPVRQALKASKHDVYWPADPHWTNFGSVIWAKVLAEKLKPKIVPTLKYRPSIDHLPQVLLQYQGETPEESIRTHKGLQPTKTRVVTPAPGTPDIDPGRITTIDHSWTTTPTKNTYRPKTALIGDSYTYLGLRSLRPIFAQGRFVWVGFASEDQIISAMVDADTVVLEQVQRYIGRSVFVQPEFMQRLRTALAQPGAQRSR